MPVKSSKTPWRRQRGLALIEVILAVLLTSAGIAGCVRYQQWIVSSQLRQQQAQQLWRSVSQSLDVIAGGATAEEAVRMLALPAQWRWRHSRQPAAQGCERLTAEVTAPLNLSARMERVVCPGV